MKNIVNVTESARHYINNLCSNGNIVFVRLASKGCSGHSYTYELISTDQLQKFDELIQWPSGGIAIEAKSVMHMLGSTLDLKQDLMESCLVWHNPQATNYCGCGESFELKT